MKLRVINHHLIQEGDAYGLIYALVLNRALRIGGHDMFAFMYVNRDLYLGNKQYRGRVDRRVGYFTSFGLTPARFKLVFCAFSKTTRAIRFTLVGGQLTIAANAKLFKSNPRLISLFLTGHENDIGNKDELMEAGYLDLTMKEDSQLREAELRDGTLESLKAQIATDEADALRKQFRGVVTRFLRRSLDSQPPSQEPSALSFAYISRSTDYVLACLKSAGYDAVVRTLRAAVLSATRRYTSDSDAYLDRFTRELFKKASSKTAYSGYAWKPFEESQHRNDPVLVLFWIRGAKPDEEAAIFDKSAKSSPGKPQHHTNLVLYKLVRRLTNQLSSECGRPFIFVPIGDELTEITVCTFDANELEYKKGAKAYNLIQFFSSPTFTGKPMGAQINFLLRLATRHQVVQVGMRSGSMERLMYLGVPTIFFDRGSNDDRLPATIGHGRIRQLCGFAGQSEDELLAYMAQCQDILTGKERRGISFKGFPLFFHIENRDTGFLRYSRFSGITIDKMIGKLLEGVDVSVFNNFKYALASKSKDVPGSDGSWRIGGLAEAETHKLALMLWFIGEVFPHYSIALGAPTTTSTSLVTTKSSVFEGLLASKRSALEREAAERLQHKRELREANDKEIDVSDIFPGLFEE